MRGWAAALRGAWILVALFAALAIFPEIAFAQKNEPAAPTETVRYWTAGYLIAIMGIVLGLLIVLRPGTRAGDEQH